MKGFKSKLIIPLVLIWILMSALAACERRPLPYDDPYNRGGNTGLPEKNFSSAFEAFSYGKNVFDQAPHFESTFYGLVTPAMPGAPQQVNYTRKYKSQNGDLVFDTANNADKILLGIETRFSFLAAIQKGADTVSYLKTSGNSRISEGANGVLFSDYSDATDLSSSNLADFKAETGINPYAMLNYIVNEDTIKSVLSFTKGTADDNFGYKFSLDLNSGSHEEYKHQVEYTGNVIYGGFGSLRLDFTMDKSCKITRVDIKDVYYITLMGKQKSTLEGTLYISYQKNPIINFNDFSVTYAE